MSGPGSGLGASSSSSSSTAAGASTGDPTLCPSIHDVKMEDVDAEGAATMYAPSSGPVRNKASSSNGEGSGEESSRAPVAAPVKSACTFCRSRKSRCNGKQPCAACVNRAQPDDCVYTISRRGGKPKQKRERVEPMESHLEKILELADLPHLVRIPNAVPQLQGFMDDTDGANFFSQQSGFPSASLSPTFSSSNGRARSTSFQMDATPSVQALLTDFYRLFFCFVPILPDSRYLDQMASTMASDSPFLLALQCVLPIIRNEPLIATAASSEEEKKASIRTQASYFARKAESAIDAVLESIEGRPEADDYHTLEVIQALCLLIIYEYGSGRALKARLKADTALGIAMSKGLHRLSMTGNNGIKSPQPLSAETVHHFSHVSDEEMFEVKKRIWWTLWSMTMWTAYNTGRIPTIRADDPRISSELPHCKDGKAWSFSVSSLQGLLLVQDRVLALSNIEHGRTVDIPTSTTGGAEGTGATLPGLPFHNSASASAPSSSSDTNDQGVPTSFSGHPTMSSRQDILQSMMDIDAALQEQMRTLEQTTEGIVSPSSQVGHTSASSDSVRYLNFVWAMQLYTASLTLHVGQAFQGAALFERKLCFLSSISESNDAAACQVPMPNAFDDQGMLSFAPLALVAEQDLYARGPFLPKESLKRCVDASDKLLQISRNLRESESTSANNPFNACSFVLISFVCLMQALAISSNVTDDDQWRTTNLGPSEAPSLLKSAQGAAALNPGSHAFAGDSAAGRQQQLQLIWARVKEARGTLRAMSKHWDMVIPMAEEVGGCLEASQFLLSQQDLGMGGGNSAPPLSFGGGGGGAL